MEVQKMKVIKCVEVDNETMMIGFTNGLTRLFKKENFLETVKNEEFYKELDENSKTTIGFGYACCTGLFKLK